MHTLVFSKGFLLVDRPLVENGNPIPPMIKLPDPIDERFYTYQSEIVLAAAGTLNDTLVQRLESAVYSNEDFDAVLKEAVNEISIEETAYFIILTDRSVYLFTIVAGGYKSRQFDHKESFAVGPNDKNLLSAVKRDMFEGVLPSCTIPEFVALSVNTYTPEITRIQYVDINGPLLEPVVIEELDFSSEECSFYPDRYRQEVREFVEKFR